MKTAFLVPIFVLSVIQSASAGGSSLIKTCRGELFSGSLDSGVGECIFLTHENIAVGGKIFDACSSGDICEIKVVMTAPNSTIKKVIYAKRLKRAQ